jgi:hypothetical protein
MKRRRSRLALAGVMVLALSVTVGFAAGGVADAKKKKPKKVSNTVTVTASNAAIPDRAALPVTAPFGKVDVPLTIGKKFKGRVVAADSVAVTVQTTGTAAGAPDDLEFRLINPKGRKVFLEGDLGDTTSSANLGPLTITPNSPVEPCSTPPCVNPDQTLVPPFAGTLGNSELALYTGTGVQGTWILRVFDDTPTKTSTLNKVTLQIGLA